MIAYLMKSSERDVFKYGGGGGRIIMRQANSSQTQSRVLHKFRSPTLKRLVMIMIIDIIKKRHAITLPTTGNQNRPIADHQDPTAVFQLSSLSRKPIKLELTNQDTPNKQRVSRYLKQIARIKILQTNSAYQDT